MWEEEGWRGCGECGKSLKGQGKRGYDRSVGNGFKDRKGRNGSVGKEW